MAMSFEKREIHEIPPRPRPRRQWCSLTQLISQKLEFGEEEATGRCGQGTGGEGAVMGMSQTSQEPVRKFPVSWLKDGLQPWLEFWPPDWRWLTEGLCFQLRPRRIMPQERLQPGVKETLTMIKFKTTVESPWLRIKSWQGQKDLPVI